MSTSTRQGDIEGVKKDMAEFRDKLLSKNPYNWFIDENWTQSETTLKQSMDKHIPQKKIKSRWN